MKNLWSLQVGEAVVAEELSKRFPPKDKYQVFIPLNNQLEDIDLILADLYKKRYVTLQVKESNTREKQYPKEKIRWGWFRINKNKLGKQKIKAVDYYVFLRHSLTEKREFDNDFIIVPSEDLGSKMEKGETRIYGKGFCTYNFELIHKKGCKKDDPEGYNCNKKNCEARDIKIGKNKEKVGEYSKYLNNFEQLRQKLKKPVKRQK